MAGLLEPKAVAAGPWEAQTPQGMTVRIVQDSYRTREAYVLDRVYADGTPDAVFGQQGSTLFTLGPDHEGPAALRLDALGRVWVAGASAGRGGTVQAVVLRFLPQGQPDTGYAEGGRSATAPGGRQARALDLAPQADGSTFVAGQVQDPQGQERVGWWRLQPDGRVDPRFGLGGLWLEPGPLAAELVDLTPTGDGSVVLRLRRGDAPPGAFETWELPAGAMSPTLRGPTGPASPTQPGASSVVVMPAAGPASRIAPAPQAINPFRPMPAGNLPLQQAREDDTSSTWVRVGWTAGCVLALGVFTTLWRRWSRARARR